MQRILAKSKIHQATVTGVDLEYEGSCSIDAALLEAADILPGEQVHVLNLRNGERAVTYAISGKPGEICLNGPMAFLGQPGDRVIILTYANFDELETRSHALRVVYPDEQNRLRPAPHQPSSTF